MAKKMIWIAHARYAEGAAVNLLCFPMPAEVQHTSHR